ncbi:MAG: DUF3520 domain-containing protein, partial [Myxococcales bacterium]|nr:DUF3520 domain-containing protein [Myxococcales bacterium]
AVAEFAEILRESPHVGQADLAAVRALAVEAARPGDATMAEFIELVDRVSHLGNGI